MVGKIYTDTPGMNTSSSQWYVFKGEGEPFTIDVLRCKGSSGGAPDLFYRISLRFKSETGQYEKIGLYLANPTTVAEITHVIESKGNIEQLCLGLFATHVNLMEVLKECHEYSYTLGRNDAKREFRAQFRAMITPDDE